MKSFQIREARAEDVSALARLRYSFRAELKAATEDEAAFLDRCTKWMAMRLVDGSWQCWVAELSESGREVGGGATLVACIWVELVEKIPNPNGDPEYHAYLTSFAVMPEHRGGGLGSRMLRRAIEWCEARGVDSIFLWPSERSRPLYERNGFGVTSMLEYVRQQGKNARRGLERV
jgi:GNAT superfamily N-acetyltransferase